MEKNKVAADQMFESYLLGAVFAGKYGQHQVLQELQIDDFYFIQHKKIFEVFKRLNEDSIPIDLYVVVKMLKDLECLKEVGGVAYLSSLMDGVGTGLDIDYYILEVKALSSKRKLLAIGQEMMIKAADPFCKAEDLIDAFARKIASIGTYSRDQFDDMKTIIDNYKDSSDFLTVIKQECIRVDRGEDLFDGVRTYYPRLDRLIGGFARGTNNIIGARSSSGKTTFLSNLFLNIHENAPHVRMGFFSLEMNKSRIMEKIICCMGGINYRDLQERNLKPDDFEALTNAEKTLRHMKLTIFDRAGININEFKSQIRRECVKNGLDIIFLDYLSIVQAFNKTGNKHQEIDQVSKGLQSISLELNIPIVTLSQLNRNIYGRPDKTPVLSDLRESGSIEEDADLVMLLHRPLHYQSVTDKPMEDVTQLIVAKSRLIGDLGKTEYTFNSGRYVERPYVQELLPNQVVNAVEAKETFTSQSFKR